METRLVRVADISTSDEEAWRELARNSIEPNPSFEPDVLVPVCRSIAACSNVTLVVAHDGSMFTGVMPIRWVQRMRIPPVTVASTFDPSWPPGQFACSPLLHRECASAAFEALLGTFAGANRDGWPGVVLFQQLSADGPVAEALRQACSRRDFALSFGETWERGLVERDRWEASLNPKHRRAFSRYRRQIADRCGGEVSVVDLSHDPGALDEFFAIELSGWKGREGGRAHAKDPGTEAYFRDSHCRLLENGRAHLLALKGGDRTVAMQYYIRSGPGLFTARIAYDDEFAPCSPGSVLLSSAIEYLGEKTDAQWIDSATQPNNEFFLRLMPGRRRFSEAIIGVGSKS